MFKVTRYSYRNYDRTNQLSCYCCCGGDGLWCTEDLEPLWSMEKLPFEILVEILNRLPGKCVEICRRVCKCWNEAADIILSRNCRQSFDTASFITERDRLLANSAIGNNGIGNYLNNSLMVIDSVILVNQTSANTQIDKKLCKQLQIAFHSSFQEDSAPKMVGTVVKFPFGPRLIDLESFVDVIETISAHPNATSILLFPKLKSYHIEKFHIPMKKKYEMIKGYQQFLPEMGPAKSSLVIVFFHPLSLGRQTEFVRAVRKKYSPETCIVGLYSESHVFNDKVVTSNEMMGMVLSGDLINITAVILNDTDIPQKVAKVHERINEIPYIDSYIKLVLVFACSSFLDIRTLGLLGQLRSTIKDTLIFGAYAPGVFGAEFNLEKSSTLPGGRDFLQMKGIVLNVLLIKRN